MRAWIGKCMMDNAEQVPPGLLESTSSSLAESHALFERWNGRLDGLIHYAFCPRFAISCTDALLRQVSEMATDLNALIHTHSSETSAENTYTNRHFGKSNVAYLDDVCMTGPHSVFAHGVHLLNGDTDILSRTSTAIAHCPSSNLKLASGIANLPELDAAGVRLSLGADGAPCNNSLDAFIEMRLAALLQKPFHGPTAMPARRTLTLATLDGARALGVDDQIGSLEVGKQADIVVLDLDGDPGTGPSGQDIYSRIVYSCHRHNVVHVFVQGIQRVDKSTLVEWDLPALIQNARQALKSITQKM